MTKLEQIRAAEARLLLTTYDRSPILFVDGEGVYIIDEKGEVSRPASGIGVTRSAITHPAIGRLLRAKAARSFTRRTSSITKARPSSRCA